MSFRKRNVGVSVNLSQAQTSSTSAPLYKLQQLPGVRPSSVDGRLVTSTGTATLDGLLAGHGGLALGCSLLLEENGTTDYAGALLRFFAAEGLVQGHHVHVIGLPEQWGRELPGLVGEPEKSRKPQRQDETTDKMKIAWRYERLGQFNADRNSRESSSSVDAAQANAHPLNTPQTFCHTFDLSKRLVHPVSSQIHFHNLEANPSKPPFDSVLAKINALLTSSQVDVIHRIIIPSFLSSAIYPPHACLPHNVLGFQRSLRALHSAHKNRIVVMQSLPLMLYPRSLGMTRWIELLTDGVVEFVPFPHSADAEFQLSRDPATKEEPPQGILRIHRLPLFHERGSGASPADNEWTYTLSRRRFTIKPFNLPPVGGDTEAQQATIGSEKKKKAEMEF